MTDIVYLTDEILQKAALDAANDARAKLGLDPVDTLYAGRPNDAYSCAITATVIDDDLDTNRYLVKTTWAVKAWDKEKEEWLYLAHLNGDAQEFVKRFDSKKYPELSIKWLKDLPKRVRKNHQRGHTSTQYVKVK